MVNHDRQSRGEGSRLLLPVANNRGGTDQKDRTPILCFPIPLDQRQGLDCFSQPHVICEACAQTPLPEKAQPGVATYLIGTQCPLKTLRWRQFAEGSSSIQRRQKIGDPSRGHDPLERNISRSFSSSKCHPHNFPDSGLLLRFLLPEFDGCLDLLRIYLDPLSSQFNQGSFQLCQSLKLFQRKPLIPQGYFPIELNDLFERQSARALHFRCLHVGPSRQR